MAAAHNHVPLSALKLSVWSRNRDTQRKKWDMDRQKWDMVTETMKEEGR